ncbi:MAG: flippase-like domain-containing protein, partial [Clostridia bacterium]|nr:flippase-like domain-containing protein [Clostridia bacterium]
MKDSNCAGADGRMADDTERSVAKKRKIKRAVGVFLFVLLNAAVLFVTARADLKGAAAEGRAILVPKNYIYLLGAILCFVTVLAVETIKYVLMMRRLGEKVSVRIAYETASLGKYYDFITPSATGGQPFQIWNLHKCGYSDGASSAMPLISYITKQYSFVILALTVFIFNNSAVDALGIKVVSYVGCGVYLFVPSVVVMTAAAPQVTLRVASFFIRLLSKIRVVKDPEAARRGARAKIAEYSTSLKGIAKDRGLFPLLLALSLLMQIAL